jgi:hypothetical protein
MSRIDQLISIVAGTGQIAGRGNCPLNSRAQFLTDRGDGSSQSVEKVIYQINALSSLGTIEWE